MVADTAENSVNRTDVRVNKLRLLNSAFVKFVTIHAV